MRALPAAFSAYRWAASTEEMARRVGLDPVELVRFDGNVPPRRPPRAPRHDRGRARRGERVRARRRLPELRRAIADYAGVGPDNVVLGAGADDLILLCARAFAGPGDTVALAEEPTYPLYRIAAGLAGAEVGGDDPVVTFCCRPNNPDGGLRPLPDARPLVVDEAYSGVRRRDGGRPDRGRRRRAPHLLEGVRPRRRPRRLRARRPRHGGRAEPPPVADADLVALGDARAGRARLAAGRAPAGRGARAARAGRARARARAAPVGDQLPLRAGRRARARSPPRSCAPAASSASTPTASASRVRDREDDDLLLEALARALDRPSPVAAAGGRRARLVRATAETRIRVRLGARRRRPRRVATGAGLYDHLLEQLAFHGGLDLVLEGVGDLETGDHHTAEDAAITLGQALDRALGDRRGITRYGDAVVPMDDALARAAVDLGGRPGPSSRSSSTRGSPGTCSRASRRRRGWRSTSRRPGATPTTVAEAAFKAVGRALRAAVRAEGAGVPSTKGVAVTRSRLRLRRRQRPLGRDRAPPARRRRSSPPIAASAPTSPCCPGVGSARVAMAGLRERGLDDGAARPRRRRAGRRSASASGCSSRSTRARRTAASPGSASCPGRARPPARRAASRASGWAAVEPSGEAFYFAHSYAAETPAATASPRASSPSRRERLASSASSSTRRRAAPPARASSAAMPLPRLIPCLDVAGGRVVKGVVPGPARRRRSGRARRRVLRRGRRRARLPRREGDDGRARARCVELVARVADGSRSRSRSAAACARAPTPRRCSRAGADKVSVNSAALARPELVERARGAARLAGGRRRDRREGGEVNSRAGIDADRPRARSTGRGRPRSAARARSC